MVVDSLSKWQWEILVSSLWMSCDQSCGPFTAIRFHTQVCMILSSILCFGFGCNMTTIHGQYNWFVQGSQRLCVMTCEHYGTNLFCILE